MQIQVTIDHINAFYRRSGYSKTTRCMFKKIGRELLEHLDNTGRKYSEGESQRWLTARIKENEGDYRTIIQYFHVVNLIVEAARTGVVEAGRTYAFLRSAVKPSSPAWQEILDRYLQELSHESKAESTIAFSRRACTKFITFLEKNGCLSPKELGVELCHRFEAEDTGHSTTNGKRAYQYRIRLFIRHLERKGLVARTMEYAVKTHYRIPRKNVTILSDTQKSELRSARKTCDPYTNRAYAMAVLALYLGLRSIDIINLKFSDIDWFGNSVKIIQQKTKKGLVLPLIPAVGNAIVDYVLNHRPDSDCPYVFVSQRLPHGKLRTKGVCHGSSMRLITQRPEGQPSGMHIMRRTLASDLLRHHVNHDLVSGFLGHSSAESIDPYLSTDSERMAECSLPLGTIGFPEVFIC